MSNLPLLLLVVSGLVASVASIWLMVNAFRVSALWGVLVFFFGPLCILFPIRHWDMAKRPFCLMLACIGVCIGSLFMLPEAQLSEIAREAGAESKKQQTVGGLRKPFLWRLISSAASSSEAKPSEQPKIASPLPAMFKAQKDAELQLRFTALQKKESELRERKAGLDAKDRASAIALAQEIQQYNAELAPLLQEMRSRGLLAAQ